LTNVVSIGDGDTSDGMAGALELGDGFVLRSIRPAGKPDVGKQAILAVDLRRSERFGIDGD